MLGQILVTVGVSIGALVVALLVAGQLARRRLAARSRPAGRLVEVDGRSVHVDVRGAGPTVVLEGGAWAPAIYWQTLADDLARDATVVTYDRAGLGHSDPSPSPRTAEAMARELRTALDAAGVPAPYVLVGHSVGGTIVRMFAHRNPEVVAGLVLVDASHEEQFELAPESLRKFQRRMTSLMRPMFGLMGLAARTGILALRPSLVPAGAAGLPAAIVRAWRAMVAARPSVVATMAREMLHLDLSNAAVRAARIESLGDIPLVVLSHGRAEGTPPQLGAEVAAAYETVWQELQVRQSALSPRGRRIVVEGAGHDIPTERPDAVLAAIRDVLAEARMAVSERPMAPEGVVTAAGALDPHASTTESTTTKERQEPMQTIGRIGRTIGTLAIAAVLAACVGTAGGANPAPGEPSVDAARAAEIAEVAFPALNSGDYGAWSAAWSDTLKGAIDAAAFEGFRQNVQSQLGAYVSHGEPVYGSKSSGTFRWTFEVEFEKGSASFAFGFVDGQTTIDGVFVE